MSQTNISSAARAAATQPTASGSSSSRETRPSSQIRIPQIKSDQHVPKEAVAELKRLNLLVQALQRRIKELEVERDRRRKADRDNKVRPQAGKIATVLTAGLGATIGAALVRCLQATTRCADNITRVITSARAQLSKALAAVGGTWSVWASVALALLLIRAAQQVAVPVASVLIKGLTCIFGKRITHDATKQVIPQAGGVPPWAFGACLASILTRGKGGVLHTLARWGRLGKGFGEFVSASSSVSDWLVATLVRMDTWLRARTNHGIPLWISALYREQAEFAANLDYLRKCVLEMRTRLATDKSHFSVGDQARVRVYLKLLAKLRLSPRASGREAGRTLDIIDRELHAIAKELQVSISAQTSKPEPVMALFVGSPGIGKSAMLPRLTNYLVEHCADPSVVQQCRDFSTDFQHEVYTRAADDSYMSGYRGQTVCVMDDFAQVKLKATNNESDFSFVITHVNTHKTHLNMAAVENKGCTPFTSSFVVATSNRSWRTEIHDHVKSAEAVDRRIKFVYSVVPYNGAFQYASLAATPPGQLPDLWHFHRTTPANSGDAAAAPTSGDSSLTLAQVAEEMAGEWRRRKQLHDQYMRADEAVAATVQEEVDAAVRDATTEPAHAQAGACAGDACSPPRITRAASFTAGSPSRVAGWDAPRSPTRDDVALRFIQRLHAGERVDFHASAEEMLACSGGGASNLQAATRLSRDIRRMVHPDSPCQWVRDNIPPDKRVAFSQHVSAELDEALHALGVRSRAPQYCHADGTPEEPCVDYWWYVKYYGVVALAIFIQFSIILIGMYIVRWVLLRFVDVVVGLFHALTSVLTLGRNKPTASEPQAQAGAADGVAPPTYILDNLHTLELELDTGRVIMIGDVFFVRENQAIMPAHFAAHLAVAGAKRAALTDRYGATQLIDVACLVASIVAGKRLKRAGSDLVLVNVPQVRRARDVSAHLLDWTPDDMHKLVNTTSLYVERAGPNMSIVQRDMHGLVPVQRQTVQDVGVALDLVRVPYNLGSGACGTLLLTRTAAGYKVAGMYVAGQESAHRGWFQTIRAAEVLLVLSTGTSGSEPETDDVVPQAGGLREYPPGLHCVSTVHDGVWIPDTTKLRRSGMEAFIGPGPHMPAKLKPSLGVNPLYNALAPFGVPRADVAPFEPALRRAAYGVLNRIKLCQGVRPPGSVLTAAQVVLGVPELGVPALPRDTGVGYPWCTGKLSRDDLLAEALVGGPFADSLDMRDQLIRTGVPLPVMFTTFLKDELRPIEKVVAGSTRPIQGAPLDYTILWRRYYGAFEAAIKGGSPLNGFGIGVNPHSDQWDLLARYLSDPAAPDPLDSLVFAGDYSKFDSSHQWALFHLYWQVAEDWYNPGWDQADEVPPDTLARYALMFTLHQPNFLVGDHVVQPTGGLPSGHPATSYINSFINLTLLATVFEQLCPGMDFWTECHPTAWGDDHVVGPSARVRGLYNQLTVVEPMARLGYTYTPETKEDLVPALRPLRDVLYLKRGFARSVTGGIVAPLVVESVLKSLRWRRLPLQGDDPFVQACETALAELAKHGPDIWELWAGLVRAGCERITGRTLPPVDGFQVDWLSRSSSLALPEWMS